MLALRPINPSRSFLRSSAISTRALTPFWRQHHPNSIFIKTFATSPPRIYHNTNSMALFQRVPGTGGSEFGSLFRLLDDYDAHRQQAGGVSRGGGLSSFAPKFDVRETRDSYVLDGDLPGVDQEDISIEFADPTTLVVRGRAEREYQAGTPPAGMGMLGGTTKGAIEGGAHQPRVEDEGAATTSAAAGPSGMGAKQATTTTEQQQEQGESRYWVSERSVGEFQRSFSFPTRVDQDAVKATLKRGVLNIVVPKMTNAPSKRITIE